MFVCPFNPPTPLNHPLFYLRPSVSTLTHSGNIRSLSTHLGGGLERRASPTEGPREEGAFT